MSLLLDPLSYEFMRYALLAGIGVGLLCPIVGSFLVVQRITLLGDVVAHAILPGLAIAHFLKIPLILGASFFGLLSSFTTTWISSQSKLKVETAMAITYASFFALGISLLTVLQNRLDLNELLFGDILSITTGDIQQIIITAILVLAAIRFFYKELLFFTFDSLGAEAMGLPVRWLNLGLMASVTLTIIAGIKTVGVILVIALMVGPAATAYLLTKELHWMMILGSTFGIISAIVGLYVSYYSDIPSGPTIAMTIFVFFFFVLLFSPSQGILMRYSRVKT
ncbi:metal ABC transporter permease [Acaryochloris marina]|uniref:metal ABC transporter permease n=1 Tax=Acaryochloris marina TaxID=155978 RepID=UPI0021C3DA4F|nr:metal ABC transporter permease [Acaryochloris marina]BDM83422.1 ABC transporter permease [Acaryochloris marina MBIC10699]